MPKRGRRKKSPYTAYAKDLAERKKDARPVNTSLSPRAREILDKHINYRDEPIFWATPCDEVMYSKFFGNFYRLNHLPWDSYGITESTYLPSARNELHNQFLNVVDADYMMMIDSDVMCPPNIVETLMGHNKHIVGGWYKNKAYTREPHPIIYDYSHETDKDTRWTARKSPGKGLEKVRGMGAGNWLMTRELAEALGESPYSMERGSEDLNLCKKIMDLGYDMYVDWDMELAHLGVSWC